MVCCPLVDELITSADCIENSDIVRGMIKEASMPAKYKTKDNWKELCKNCKYYDF